VRLARRGGMAAHWTRTYRSVVVFRVMAFLGATATVVQVVLWMLDQQDLGARRTWLLLFCSTGLLMILAGTRAPSKIDLELVGTGGRVIIEIGNLFEAHDQTIVVTVNRWFDTTQEWIAPSSLMGQLSRRWYGGEFNEIEQGIAGARAPGRGEPGEIVALTKDGRTALLLAVADRDDETRSAVYVDEVWASLSRLWMYARRNDLPSMAVSVIGTGYSRARSSHALLLSLLLLSYATATFERPVCVLRIVVPPRAPGLEILEQALSCCQALGFREYRSSPLPWRRS
jgi:hypothetical protein